MIFPGLFESEDARRAIDVPLHEMTAELALREERAFQVNDCVAAQLSEVGAIERFLQKVEGDLLCTMRRDREATAVNGDAVSCPGVGRDPRRRNLELHSLIGGADPKQLSNFLHKAGEHPA